VGFRSISTSRHDSLQLTLHNGRIA